MDQLAKILMLMCLNDMIPNPHAVENLTKYQKELIYEDAQIKCTDTLNSYLNLEEAPMCQDSHSGCM